MESDDEFVDDYNSSDFSENFLGEFDDSIHASFMDLNSPSRTQLKPLPHLNLILILSQMLKK